MDDYYQWRMMIEQHVAMFLFAMCILALVGWLLLVVLRTIDNFLSRYVWWEPVRNWLPFARYRRRTKRRF